MRIEISDPLKISKGFIEASPCASPAHVFGQQGAPRAPKTRGLWVPTLLISSVAIALYFSLSIAPTNDVGLSAYRLNAVWERPCAKVGTRYTTATWNIEATEVGSANFDIYHEIYLNHNCSGDAVDGWTTHGTVRLLVADRDRVKVLVAVEGSQYKQTWELHENELRMQFGEPLDLEGYPGSSSQYTTLYQR